MRSPGQDGGTITTRSTPASSIIGTSRSIVNGSGNWGTRPGTHFQSGDSAFHRCTCASVIKRRSTWARAVLALPVASAAPAPSVVVTNCRRVCIARSSLKFWSCENVGMIVQRLARGHKRGATLSRPPIRSQFEIASIRFNRPFTPASRCAAGPPRASASPRRWSAPSRCSARRSAVRRRGGPRRTCWRRSRRAPRRRN